MIKKTNKKIAKTRNGLTLGQRRFQYAGMFYMLMGRLVGTSSAIKQLLKEDEKYGFMDAGSRAQLKHAADYVTNAYTHRKSWWEKIKPQVK